VRQQIWGEVVDFIPAFSAVNLKMWHWKNDLNWLTFAKVIVKIKIARFYGPQCTCITMSSHRQTQDTTDFSMPWMVTASVRHRETEVVWFSYILTFASSVRHHNCPVLALVARQTVIGLAAPETVDWTGAAVVSVEHVVMHAGPADHDIVLLRVRARTTVERACWKQPYTATQQTWSGVQ